MLRRPERDRGMKRFTKQRPSSRALWAIVVCWWACDNAASAAGLFHKRAGTPPPGRPRAIEHTMHRAGQPLVVSPYAAPTIGPGYAGYYLGGGSAHGGDPRRIDEGTWGWDYSGACLPHRVWLDWSHGRRHQGGTGYYKIDGLTRGQ
jgi:hypothetical protein